MKKNGLVSLAMFIAILLSACDNSKSVDAVSKYLKAEASCDYESAYDLLSQSDKNVKPMNLFKEEEVSEFGLLFTEAVRKSTVFKVVDSIEKENEAVVNVEITQDDYSSLVSEMFGAAFTEASSDDLKKKSKQYKESVPAKTHIKTFNLIKEDNQWHIFFNWEKEAKIKELTEKADSLKQKGQFESALGIYNEIIELESSDENAAQNIEELNSLIKLLQEKLDYMKNIVVYDFSARYYETYFEGSVPGFVFKIKNNGGKELSLIEVTIYFKDAAGVIIYEYTFCPVNKNGFWNSNTLKPNHIWQPERGSYYKAESVPSEWAEGSADIKITDIEFEQ